MPPKYPAAALVLVLISALPVEPASLTGEDSAILTDVHNRVIKRKYVDWARKVWGEASLGCLGDSLPEGTQVGTAERSWAQISWTDVNSRIWEQTVVAIAPHRRVVYLLDGELLFNLRKDRKLKQSFDLETKMLQARVHGTTVLVQASSSFSRLTVLEGSLDVKNLLDGSSLRLRPGVVYEVRTGAPPAPTWGKQEELNLDLLKNSSLEPLQFGEAKHSKPQAPVEYTYVQETRKKYSDAQVEQKAQEMSRGDPARKAYLMQELQKQNPDVPVYVPVPKQPISDTSSDPQSRAINTLKSEPPSFGSLHSLLDTSEFAPLKGAKSIENENTGKMSKRSALMQDICSKSVPPISLFRTAKSASNLYLLDLNEIMKHSLLRGFSTEFASKKLVYEELSALPPICRLGNQNGEKQAELQNMRNSVFSSEAQVLNPPTEKSFKLGHEMKNERSLPEAN